MTSLRTSAVARCADRQPALRILQAAAASALAAAVLALSPPVASAATAITLSGTGQTATIASFGQVAAFSFTATAGQRVSAILDTATFTSGSIEIRRLADNVRVASAPIKSTGAFLEPAVLDAGSYEIRVSAGTGTGTARVRAWSVVDGSVTGAVGTPLAVTIATPGQSTSVRFTGSAGQRIAARASASGMVLRYELRAPDGTLLRSSSDETKGLLPGVAPYIDATTLTAAGTYSLVVNPVDRATGSVMASVAAVTDVTGTLALGTPGTGTTTVAGQTLRYAVPLVAGRRVSLRAQTPIAGVLSLLTPTGTQIASRTTASGGAFAEPVVVPTTGTYTVVFDPNAIDAGSATLTAFDVPTDVGGTITLGADATPLAFTAPGQNARLTFSGTAGARVSVALASAAFAGTVAVLRPEGTVISTRTIASGGAFIEPITLPSTGTYAIVVDPALAATGTAALRAFDAPADTTAAIATNGTPATATISGAGQVARLTFSGTAGQRVSVAATNGTFAANSAPIRLLRPAGTSITQMNLGASGFIEPQTLPSTGTYTVLVDPIGAALGSASIRIFVVTDIASSTNAGAAADATVFPIPGQVARITIPGTVGTKLTLTLDQATVAGTVSVLRPNGTRLAGPLTFAAAGRILLATPTTTGTHTIVLDPTGAGTGSVRLAVRAG